MHKTVSVCVASYVNLESGILAWNPKLLQKLVRFRIFMQFLGGVVPLGHHTPSSSASHDVCRQMVLIHCM